MPVFSLDAHVRTESETGSSAAGKLRRAGSVPATVYGLRRDPVSIKVDGRAFDVLQREMKGTAVIELNVGSILEPVVLQTVHRHPITLKPYNIDFLRIDMSKPIHVKVRVHVTAVPHDLEGNETFQLHTDELLVECLPADIPPMVDVDASGVTSARPIHVGDLMVPGAVTVLTSAETVVGAVHRRGAGQVLAEEAELAAAGEEAAEAEATGTPEE